MHCVVTATVMSDRKIATELANTALDAAGKAERMSGAERPYVRGRGGQAARERES